MESLGIIKRWGGRGGVISCINFLTVFLAKEFVHSKEV